MKLLIDADIVCMRAAFSAEDETEAWIPCSRATQMIEDMLEETQSNAYELWLSGKSNFRYDIFPEYKANRIAIKRPKWENEIKDYLERAWDANWSEGCEADDMLAIRHQELGENSILASIDKDLDQSVGWHYNFVKKEKYYVDELQAFRFFCYQLLVGDTADGIKGVPGIGPVKANKLLDGFPRDEWLEEIRLRYGSDEEMEMNAKVLWIWKKKDDVWTGPQHANTPS
jgi:DNA polymerase-1